MQSLGGRVIAHLGLISRISFALWGVICLFVAAEAVAQKRIDQLEVSQLEIARAAVAGRQEESAPSAPGGEACRVSDAKLLPGLSQRDLISDVFCGKDRVGFFLEVGDRPTQNKELASADELLDRLSKFLLTNEGVACEGSLRLSFGGRAMRAVPCRDIADGLPSIALINQSAAGSQIAYGTPSLLQYLVYLLGAEAVVSPEEIAILLAGAWGTPVAPDSFADRSTIIADWSAAREAGSKLDFTSAQTRLEAALAVQVRLSGETDFTTGALLLDLAMVIAYQEDFAGAKAIIRRAGPIIDSSPRASDRARLSGYQASIAMLEGNYAEASSFAQEASSNWRKITSTGDQQTILSLFQSPENQMIDAQPELALSLAREASILLRLGDAVSAYAKASEALFTLNLAQRQPPIWRAEILAILGETSSALGRLSASETFFAKAMSIRRSTQGDGAGMVRLLLAQGRTYHREMMNVNTIITFRRAINMAKQLPRGSIVLRVNDLTPFAQAVLAEAEMLESEQERIGLMTELFDAFQLVFVPGRDEVVNLASMQASNSDPVIADLVNSLKQSMLAYSEVRGKFEVEQSKVTGDRNDFLVGILLKELEEQTNKSAALRNTIENRYPEYIRFSAKPLPDLNALRGALARDEALASFLIGREASFLQLITRERVYITAITAGEDELNAMVRDLRKGLELEGGSVSEFKLDEAYNLYLTLFAGVIEPLAAVRNLIVVPNGPLSSLPFGTLLTSPPVGEDYSNAPWLVNRMAVTLAPSIVSFVNLRSTRPARWNPKPFLGVANPRFTAASQIVSIEGSAQSCNPDGIALSSRFDALAKLSDTIDEVRSVVQSLGLKNADLFTDLEAREEIFGSEDLEQYNIIYIATHAVMPGEVACQREPGIALARPTRLPTSRAADGFLDASEVAALRIAANLVVLSACNTATGGSSTMQKGEALSGLAESFFIAGARSLLVTHWQIPSAATASLMRSMFHALGNERSLTTARGLQRAQILAISKRDTSHPFFWGAFAFVGSGTETVFIDERGL
jgi:CHAT domain-containing protein